MSKTSETRNMSDASKTVSYVFSERMYVIECALSYFISIITSGAYLAKLTTSIGISDSMTAILSSISSLACVFQLMSIPLSHKKSYKGTVITSALISNLLRSLLYLIPFFGFAYGVNSALFFICILFSYVFLQIGAPLKFTWFMSLPSPEQKGAFQSVVQMFSRATGLVFSFAASWLLDCFTKSGQTEAMFLTFSLTILGLSLCSFIALVLSSERKMEPAPRSSILSDIKVVIRQPGFVTYVVMYIVYAIAFNITGSFLGTYMVKDLGLSMVQISVLTAVNSVVAVIALGVFGRFAKKKVLAKSIMAGYPIYALSHLFVTFATPSNGFTVILLYYVFNPIGNAGVLVGMEPILFDTVAEGYRASAISLKNVIAGLIAFPATLAATPLMNYIQSSDNSFLGIKMYAQQLFGAISCVLMLVSMALFASFIRKANATKSII